MSASGARTVVEAILRDLLIDALPYVEAAQDDREHNDRGRERARLLGVRIRQTVKSMKEARE